MGKHRFPNEIQDPVLRETAYLIETIGDFIEVMTKHVKPPTLPFMDDDLNDAFLHICQHYGAMQEELEKGSVSSLAQNIIKSAAEATIGQPIKMIVADSIEDAIRQIAEDMVKERGGS